MSWYKDIIVITEKTTKGDCCSPELTGDYICELLAHKNRSISGVESIALDAKNLEDIIGKYCNIIDENTISFSYANYNSVFLPLWKRFQTELQSYDFLTFTSPEASTSLIFENASSPNIIYCGDKFAGPLGMSLEDFMRSEYFSTEYEYQVLSLWCHHE